MRQGCPFCSCICKYMYTQKKNLKFNIITMYLYNRDFKSISNSNNLVQIRYSCKQIMEDHLIDYPCFNWYWWSSFTQTGKETLFLLNNHCLCLKVNTIVEHFKNFLVDGMTGRDVDLSFIKTSLEKFNSSSVGRWSSSAEIFFSPK